MRPRLDATNIGFLDIADQPPSSHVLIVAEHFGSRCAMAVDFAETKDGVSNFYLRDTSKPYQSSMLVATVPTHLTWTMVKRDVLSPMDTKSYLTKIAKDNVDVMEYARDLNDQYKERIKKVSDGLTEVVEAPVERAAGFTGGGMYL